MGELSDFAQEYAESLAETTGYLTLITDRDVVVAVAGDLEPNGLIETCTLSSRRR